MPEEKNSSEKKTGKKFLGIDLKDLYQGVMKSLMVTGIISLLGLGWHFIFKTAATPEKPVTAIQRTDTLRGFHLFSDPFIYLEKTKYERLLKSIEIHNTMRSTHNLFEFYIYQYDLKLQIDRSDICEARNSTGKTILWGLLFLFTYGAMSLTLLSIVGKLTDKASATFHMILFMIFFILVAVADIFWFRFALAVFLWYLFKLILIVLLGTAAGNIAYFLVLLLLLGINLLSEQISRTADKWTNPPLMGWMSVKKLLIPVFSILCVIFLLYRQYAAFHR